MKKTRSKKSRDTVPLTTGTANSICRNYLGEKYKKDILKKIITDLILTLFLVQLGGGILYDLSKKAMLTKNYKELDDTIRQRLPPYLYNKGKGILISL
jgi:hypothetical protein